MCSCSASRVGTFDAYSQNAADRNVKRSQLTSSSSGTTSLVSATGSIVAAVSFFFFPNLSLPNLLPPGVTIGVAATDPVTLPGVGGCLSSPPLEGEGSLFLPKLK